MNQDMVKQIIERINEVTDLLYQENVKDGYVKLSEMLQIVIAATGDITDESEQTEFVAILQPALEAMEANDYTLLADILQYDLIAKFEEYL